MKLAIAASITSAVTVFLKLRNSNSNSSKVLYAGSVFTHLTAAGLGTYQLLATSKSANLTSMATKLGRVISKTMPFRAASLLGPKGILIMLAVEAIAYALEKWAEANERDKELDWIEQSIWGTKPNPQWTWEKERYQILKMFMKPKVDYSADRLMGREDVTVILPGYQPQVSDFEVYKGEERLTKDKYGSVLKPTTKDRYGSRIIKYERVKYWGVVSVIYWPNRFADPETYYKADTNWIWDGHDPHKKSKRRTNMKR